MGNSGILGGLVTSLRLGMAVKSAWLKVSVFRFLHKGEPPSISQTVNSSDFVNLLMEIECICLLIKDFSKTCNHHVDESPQDDFQIKTNVSRIFNVVFI